MLCLVLAEPESKSEVLYTFTFMWYLVFRTYQMTSFDTIVLTEKQIVSASWKRGHKVCNVLQL